ncbi:MAG: hypothetical protein E5W93_02755 [Mesorhizobium sp.]|nr:MAG: hypothetical protein E5W93_02755 [Mesorhizobium sp.]
MTRHKRRGGLTTSRINRRVLLFHSGSVVVASTAPATALATEPCRDREPSNELRALIEAHKTAYAVLGQAVHQLGSGSDDYDRASRGEERALLAICAFSAVREADRLAKARYLLGIEARGELDLPEHMQAILRSTTWKG